MSRARSAQACQAREKNQLWPTRQAKQNSRGRIHGNKRGYGINREQHIDHKYFLEIRKFEAKDHKGSLLWLESLDSESCEDYKEQQLASYNVMPWEKRVERVLNTSSGLGQVTSSLVRDCDRERKHFRTWEKNKTRWEMKVTELTQSWEVQSRGPSVIKL